MKVERSRLDAYLNRIQPPICPLCGKSDWTASDTVFQVPEFNYKGYSVGSSSVPVIPLVCDSCGNTYFINVLSAKLYDPKEKDTNTIDAEVKEQGEHNERG